MDHDMTGIIMALAPSYSPFTGSLERSALPTFARFASHRPPDLQTCDSLHPGHSKKVPCNAINSRIA
ncbi:hypothetical protein AcW1_006535 [Taiwanofungus camphoratus]|nr:hypothetical protein AcV5_009124 [Antrodia cinnamomea]KAI0954742.1 hypothetical protein AcW1_006535 [Antrodia cinnamomea]